MKRPVSGDYAPYYQVYIDKVEGENILSALKSQIKSTQAQFESISEEKGNFRYAEGKWSIKEVLGHMIDTERVMAYRAFCFSRNESQPLPGFEQDDYINNANYNERTLQNLFREFAALRESNISLVENFNAEMFDRKGTASGWEVSVNALLYIIAGHEAHHVKIIKEKYL